jgi:(R,R)-butanediol dehydrogenase / meso-butanediol dehydrogenase / diacetyl reductase
MRAAVFHAAGRPLAIERVSDPSPAPDQVVIEVERAGVCGSDLHVTQFPGVMPPGLILGHEFAGRIAAVGRAVRGGWKAGDRVTALPLNACGGCEACDEGLPALCPANVFMGNSLATPGAYAQYVAARGPMLQRLPDGVDFDLGAMVEPLSVAHHVVDMAELATGASVLVIGAGPIGAAVSLFARHAGARHVGVSERSSERRTLALEVGATLAIDPQAEDVAAAFERHAGRRPQVVFECVGLPGLLDEAVRLVGLRGRVVVAGVVFQPDPITPLTALAKEISIRFSQCYTERDFAAVMEAVDRGELQPQPLHTSTVSFEALPDAFEALRSAPHQCKVLIAPAG